jgi:protein-export membrane protein SecD
LLVPACVAVVGFVFLRLGPVEATYQRFVGPSFQAQLVLEMNTKELMQEWLEATAGLVRRILGGERVAAVTSVEPDESIRVRSVGGAQVNAEVLAREIAVIYPRREYEDLEVKTAADGAVVTFGPSTRSMRTARAMEVAIERLRQRLTELGVWSPVVQREGDHRILITAPGYSDLAMLKVTLAKRGRLSFHAVLLEVTEEQTKRYQGSAEAVIVRERGGGKFFLVRRAAAVSDVDVVAARVATDRQTSEEIVEFTLNMNGARMFGKLTAENVGSAFAVVLDGEVVSAPVIRGPIPGGRGQISAGGGSGARALAAQLRSGRLPASFTVIEERLLGSQ